MTQANPNQSDRRAGTRVQVLGPDGEWWSVDEITEAGYVTLWRPRTEFEKARDRKHDYKKVGVTASVFEQFAGRVEAQRICSAHTALSTASDEERHRG